MNHLFTWDASPERHCCTSGRAVGAPVVTVVSFARRESVPGKRTRSLIYSVCRRPVEQCVIERQSHTNCSGVRLPLVWRIENVNRDCSRWTKSGEIAYSRLRLGHFYKRVTMAPRGGRLTLEILFLHFLLSLTFLVIKIHQFYSIKLYCIIVS